MTEGSPTRATSSPTLSRTLSGGGILLVGLSAVLLSLPNPSLDWEKDVLPSALQYMEYLGLNKNTGTIHEDETKLLEGFVVAVTGATSGIGLELTRALAKRGATVIAIGRSKGKLQQLQAQSTNIQTVVADLTDLESVANAAEQMLKDYDHIDVLVNNAGIHMGFNMYETPTTKQGYDIVFGVNYLSHFLLTEKLLPLLKQSSKPKILQISSSFHWAVDGSDLRRMDGDTTDIVASQPGGSHGFLVYRSQRQYANSKLAQILHARSLQRQNITAISACPAWVGTQIVAKQGSFVHRLFSNVAFPVHGFGLSSILHALFDTPKEKEMDYYVNTALNGPNRMDQMPAWMYKALPLRDLVCFLFAFLVLLPFQRFFPVRQTSLSSRVSYQEDLQDELYRWSREAVAEWL